MRAGGIDRVLQLTLFLEQRVHLVVAHGLGKLVAYLIKFFNERNCLGYAFLNIAAYVLVRVQLRLLWQVTHLDTGLWSRLAIKLGVETGHDAQYGGLTRTVEAQNANLGTRIKGE